MTKQAFITFWAGALTASALLDAYILHLLRLI